MPKLFKDFFKNMLLGEKTMSLFDDLEWYLPDAEPANTIITNLWILTKAGAMPWRKPVSKKNSHSASHKGHVRFGIINEIVGEITTSLLGIIITIYKTVNKNDDVEYLLTIKLSPQERVTKQVFETKGHHNEKLQEIFGSLDSGFFGSVEFSHSEIDQAQHQVLKTINSMN